MDVVKVKRFDVCLISLDPTKGSEIKKRRPCLVISPDSMNMSQLKTLIVAPMTTTIREHFPTRIPVEFNNKKGQIALDQLRAIDRSRIVKNVGAISSQLVKRNVLHTLQILFS